MTFIPTEKHPGRPRWELTPDEWRLLMITFLGGIGSIVVGAGLIGVALALVRVFHPGAWGWIVWALVGFGTIGCWVVVLGWRLVRPPGFGFIGAAVMVGPTAVGAALMTLVVIGVAAGVH